MGKPKLLLGIDPGLNITGYGIIDVSGPDPQMVEAGVIKNRRNEPLHKKLISLHAGMQDLLDSFAIDALAIEELYSHYERPTTAIIMGHARGVLMLSAAKKDIPVYPYPATQVKKMLTGNGRAPKSQVQMAMARMLNLQQIPDPPDVADALAIAACHHFLSQRPASLI